MNPQRKVETMTNESTDPIEYYEAGDSQNVRGVCPHRHQTAEEAQRCLEQDQRDCRAIGGGAYSDRRTVYAVYRSGRRLAE